MTDTMGTGDRVAAADRMAVQGRTVTTTEMTAESGADPELMSRWADRLELLAARADDHEQAARSPRTRAHYAGDWAHFTAWCDMVDRAALPAQVETVRWYLSDLEAACDEHGARLYQPATLARRLAAIAATHHDTGHPSPTRDPRVRAVLSGITRTRRHTPHQMRPLLLADLRTILSGLDYSSWPAGVAAARDAFALLAGFAGALRRSELAALTTDDLTWHPTDGLYLRIRASKTDQEGRGATVVLPFGTHPGTCPPCAWLRWARLLDAAQRGRAELMRAVFTTSPWPEWTHLCRADTPAPETAAGDITPDASAEAIAAAEAQRVERVEALATATGLASGDPVLCAVRKSGIPAERPISGDGLHIMVKRRAQAAGIPGPLGFHSLRAGFVTQARRAGADTRAVRRQTRHSSDAMVELYDRDHAPLLGNAVLELGL